MAVWGETGTVCVNTQPIAHDTMSHMTPSPRDNVVTQRGDSQHSAPGLSDHRLSSARVAAVFTE